MTAATGTLYGVGVGPGDPELLTLKAVRIIRAAPAVAYLTNSEGRSQARNIAAGWLSPEQLEIPIPMVFETDRNRANQIYDHAAATLTEVLSAGQDVVVLCEGDPLFFGSFIHLLKRLKNRFPCAVVPGLTSVGAATAVAARPLAAGNDSIAIIPATAGMDKLRQVLQTFDSIVIMKPGRYRPRILELLHQTGRIEDAVYVEQATRRDQRIVVELDNLEPTPGPYFALFLITPRGNA